MPTLRYWLLLGLAVFSIKAAIYLLDPDPGFFLGDSASYIYTAVSGWIPPDRSYVYGYFIRIASLGSQSLAAMVVSQVLLAGISCLILAFMLLRFGRVAPVLAGVVALLCTVEPLQLLFERFAMAETSSLFVFTVYLLTVLYYVQRRALWLLLLAAALGVLATSLRTAYLPVTLGLGLLAVLTVLMESRGSAGGTIVSDRGRRFARIVVHLTAFTLAFFALLSQEESPRKNSDDGFFLAVAWSPLLVAPDFPRDARLNAIIDGSRCEMDWVSRTHNMWWDNCLKSRIHKEFPDYHEANDYARGLAMAALWDQPAGVLGLGFQTWQALWSKPPTLKELKIERGVRKIPDDFADLVNTNFGLDVRAWDSRTTLVGSYFESMGSWYQWVALSPLLLVLWWLLTLRRLHPYSLLIAAATVLILISATVPVMATMVRYYQPIAWLSFFGIAGVSDWLWRWITRRSRYLP